MPYEVLITARVMVPGNNPELGKAIDDANGDISLAVAQFVLPSELPHGLFYNERTARVSGIFSNRVPQ